MSAQRHGRRNIFRAGAIALAAILSVWLFSPTTSWAQTTPVSVGLSVDPPSVAVGDRFTLTLSASHPADHHVVFPSVPADWGVFEVRKQTPLPVRDNGDGTFTSSVEIEAVLFDLGKHSTPALSVSVRRPDGTMINRPARPIDVDVIPLRNPDDQELRDLRPQAVGPSAPVWPYAGGGVLGLAVIALVANHFWRRRMAPAAALVDGQQLTPLEAALAELNRLDGLNLPARARFEEHYTLLSACLRGFVDGSYAVPAHEMTTPQTVESLRSAGAARTDVNDLSVVLEESDLVKFARFLPDPDEAQLRIEDSRKTVRRLAVGSSRFPTYFRQQRSRGL